MNNSVQQLAVYFYRLEVEVSDSELCQFAAETTEERQKLMVKFLSRGLKKNIAMKNKLLKKKYFN